MSVWTSMITPSKQVRVGVRWMFLVEKNIVPSGRLQLISCVCFRYNIMSTRRTTPHFIVLLAGTFV